MRLAHYLRMSTDNGQSDIENNRSDTENMTDFKGHKCGEYDDECPICYLDRQVERLESYCRDYAEMTGITLNVPDEQREAFNKAVLGKQTHGN